VDIFPEVFECSDIPVVPFVSLFDWDDYDRYHVGGPIWPSWELITGPRFQFRTDVDRYGPIDVCPQPCEIESVDDGDHNFWIGPIYDQFGHQVRDLSTRIMPTLIADPQAVLVFGTFASSDGSLASTRPFFRGILDWYNVPAERVRIVNRPTQFKRLRVVPQAEPGGCADFDDSPHPFYIDALTRHAEAQLGILEKRGVTFVSRSQSRPLISGESEFDAWFERSGYRVFHPEKHSVRDQLVAYASAEKLVFSEGSAIHGVQLLGRNLGHVIVISRRPGRSLGFSLLNPRAEKVSYINSLKGLIAAPGEHHDVNGFAVLDVRGLVDKLHKEGVDLRSKISLDAFYTAQRRDLDAWISRWGFPMLASEPKAFREMFARILRFRPPGMLQGLVRIGRWRFISASRVNRTHSGSWCFGWRGLNLPAVVYTSSPDRETIRPLADVLDYDLDALQKNAESMVYGKAPSSGRLLPAGVVRITDKKDHMATHFQELSRFPVPVAAVEVALVSGRANHRYGPTNVIVQDQGFNTLYWAGTLTKGARRTIVGLPKGTRAIRVTFTANEQGYIRLPKSVKLTAFAGK
jgi:hypothetical protein